MRAHTWLITFFLIVFTCDAMMPPRFEWKVIDFAWESYGNRDIALDNRFYIPEANLPTGLARWGDKLFITIPRWKKGVPSSLNYINLTEDGPPNKPLHPYPSWRQGFLPDSACCAITNSTVVSAFRPYVDVCNRLWVADNGATNMIRENGEEVRQIVNPSILVFDLTTDTLLQKFEIPAELLKDSSVMSSIVVDTTNPVAKTNDCGNSFAYITDMGANAVIVYSLGTNTAWKVESPFFHFDPHASTYNVGGIEFFWHDGVSSAALGPIGSDGYRELFLQPTSSTKLFKVSTQLLRNQTTHPSEYYTGVKIVGDRGPESQVTACDYDDKTNVLFYTQISKNGVGCWSLDKNFVEANHPVIFNDCELLEFPNDIKVDAEGNMWVLSDRQHRFKQSCMDFNEINFRIFQISVKDEIKNTTCWSDRLDSKPVLTSKETPIPLKVSSSGSSFNESYSESGTSKSSDFSVETIETENKKTPNKEKKQNPKDDKATTKPLVEAKPIPDVESKVMNIDPLLSSTLGPKPPVINIPKKLVENTKPDISKQKQEVDMEEKLLNAEKQCENTSKNVQQENKSIQTESAKNKQGFYNKFKNWCCQCVACGWSANN